MRIERIGGWHRRRKQFHSRGTKRNIHCDAAICNACICLCNKVSTVKYLGVGGPAALPGFSPMTGGCLVVVAQCHSTGVSLIAGLEYGMER